MESFQNMLESTCNFDCQQQDFLSNRVNMLNLRIVTPKCLGAIINHSPLRKRNIQFLLNDLADTENSQKKKKGKTNAISHLKRTSAPIAKKGGVSLKNARFYQILDNTKNKEPAIKRKDIRQLKIFNGQGILIFQDGKKYEGQWLDGILFDDAKITYKNGEIYFGSIHNFQRHGKGYLYFANGQKYVGYFSFGIFHGQGIMYNRQGGIVNKGRWFQGKMLQQIQQGQELSQLF